MTDNLDTKVVIKQSVLHGSTDGVSLQRVATVYIDRGEYRVSAPVEAKGAALGWAPHFIVRQMVEGEEVEIHDAFGVFALKLAKEELEKEKRDAHRSQGMHPDGIHCDAQICLSGHIQHCGGDPFDSKAHCKKCGATCIDECPKCKEPIQGVQASSQVTSYSRPQFCHRCGQPYPWMEDRLKTARDLLYHDGKLSIDERNELWPDLEYVMSDPKADLAPAKKKLIEIKLGKATEYVKDALLDLMAKTIKEVLTG
jgi:hypothetical protein